MKLLDPKTTEGNKGGSIKSWNKGHMFRGDLNYDFGFSVAFKIFRLETLDSTDNGQ